MCQCNRRYRSGPFVPTIEQVQEAASRLPNPTRRSPQVMQSYVASPPGYFMCPRGCCGQNLCASCDVAHVLRFELRSNVDEYGSVLYGWVYSGGVRV